MYFWQNVFKLFLFRFRDMKNTINRIYAATWYLEI